MGKAFEIEYKHKKVEIHIIDFVGNVRDINGTPDLFSLSYNSNIQDKGQYILATEAEINIYEDAYFNIDELKTVGETDILIKYFEHDELVWQGFALPDFFQTGITKPRVLRIVATDRLGVLKDIANTSTATTPKAIIEQCLLQTGLSLPVEIRNNNTYLETTTINRERIEGVSAYDVIRSFMVQFNSKIVQYKNKWWVVNKKLLEDGFLGQEIIDIDLVYLDGQREIKPTASEVSLFLEFGGSKKYPKNWNFENWSGSNFLNWTSKNGFIQQKNNKQIVDYTLIGGAGGYYKANYGTDTIETSLYIKTDGADGNWFGNYYTKPHIESAPERIPFKDDFVDITISVNFTTASTRALRVLPLIRIINNNPLQHEYFVIQNSGEVTRVGRGEINLDGIQSLVIDDNSDGSNLLEAIQSNWSNTFKVDTSVLGMTRSTNADIRLLIFQPRLNHFSESDVDIFVHSAEFIFNKDEQTHKGLIFKTKQGGDKFSKVRETETTLFSDKINQGVNGYFYNYKYDDTSITNLPKEYLLEMTRQMADMFCSARDFYSLGGKFKVNPLARYRCGDKYFVFVGGVSHRENSEIDIEEIVSNDTLIRTDYIYTYFEDSKDNIKSIGTASGSGGAGGTGGGGGMTSSQLEMLTNLSNWWKLDEEGNLYTEKNMYSQQGVSALGLGTGGGGGGGEFDRLDKWEDYNSTKANWVLSALLGYDLHTRVNSLEAGGGSSNIDIAITGSGNAVTGVSKSGNTLTFAKGINFALASHNHTIANITGLQDALDNKEPIFTKNTAFNKNFGTAVGTVAQGNDSRINNGQTAFGWGNHSSAGYALNSALTAHTGNTTVHITATERTNWNDADSKKHTHSNKALLDLITQSNIDVLAKLSIVDGNIKVDTTLWATGGISALGLGEGSGSSGGGGADMLDSWANYTTAKANYYAPASLLVPFRSDTLSRLTSLESGSATSITTTGSGNAITSLTKSGSAITANKGLTFALASHTHTIAQITGLQGALNLKVSQSDIATAINGIEIGGRNLIRYSDFSQESNINKWELDGTARSAEPINFGGRHLSIIGISDYEIGDKARIRTESNISLVKGTTYTISYYGVASGWFNEDFDDGFYKTPDSGYIKIPTPSKTMVGEEIYDGVNRRIYKYTSQFTFDEATSESAHFLLGGHTNSGILGTHWFMIGEIKLEKGTKATDWTPAPEDQVTDWNVTDVNSFAFLKNKPTLLSQFTDNIGVTSHIANKANPHNVTKAQVGLGNADNTSDLLKPISTATQNALNGKLNLTGGTLSGELNFGHTTTRIWHQRIVAGTNNFEFVESGVAVRVTFATGGNVGIGTPNPLYKLDVSGTGRFTSSLITPKVDFGNGFTIEPSGTELVFKYNGVIKQRMLSDGTILAVGGITALST